ncbi:hypothetical protein [Marinoscillum pacificum]|uniref:hypothetical protein n=1 Tax=Marinoscillum pacificum TaxID=392723 RepID=UPI00215757D4|nr:hypothetical protein [Marinoscillum pacificum]
MKELHFYFQSVMIILALALAAQEPNLSDVYGFAVFLQFILGCYQYGMSWFLMLKLKKKSRLLIIYFILVPIYFIMLLILGQEYFEWQGDSFLYMLFGVPWILAIFFLVVIEELLRRKPVMI